MSEHVAHTAQERVAEYLAMIEQQKAQLKDVKAELNSLKDAYSVLEKTCDVKIDEHARANQKQIIDLESKNAEISRHAENILIRYERNLLVRLPILSGRVYLPLTRLIFRLTLRKRLLVI